MPSTPPPNAVPVPATPENGHRYLPFVATPVARREHRENLDPRDAKSRNLRLMREAEKFIVGPMPVQEFIDEFLPKTKVKGMPSAAGAFSAVPTTPKDEKDLYGPLIKAINKGKRKRSRCPGFEFCDTSDRSETRGPGSMTPDICGFHKNAVDETIAPGTDGKHFAHMGLAELFFEVKKFANQDFFTDPHSDADRSEHQFILNIGNKDRREYAAQALGQNVAYAGEACARQYRNFYFSLSLSGTSLRFFRWDRAGAIVSESFNIHEHPEYLCDFLWRFSHASNTDRGFDPTVEFAHPDGEAKFLAAIQTRVAFETGLTGDLLKDAVEEHYKPDFVTVMNVFDTSKQSREKFLVSRPVVSPMSVASRATRGYWGVAEDGTVVFIKDTWHYRSMGQEGEALEDMTTAEVVNIPKLRLHGDIPECTPRMQENTHAGSSDQQWFATADVQATRTNEFRDQPWHCKAHRKHIAISSHIHYRLVLNTVGYPLKRFEDAKELFHASFDAYEAMASAYESNNRLHRDISIGNILLVREATSGRRRGVLIDWEFSIQMDDKCVARDFERTGTWNFMSSRILVRRGLQHTIQDDMESMLYVVLYCALRWLPLDVDEERSLSYVVKSLFDECTCDPKTGVMVGGVAKDANRNSRIITGFVEFRGEAIRRWFYTALGYHGPQQNPDHHNKWENPKPLAQFWKNFLSEESDNFRGEDYQKVENEVDDAAPADDAPNHATLPSAKISHESLLQAKGAAVPNDRSGKSKRRLDEGEDDDVEPGRKRRRAQVNEPEMRAATGGGTRGAGPSNAPVETRSRTRAGQSSGVAPAQDEARQGRATKIRASAETAPTRKQFSRACRLRR